MIRRAPTTTTLATALANGLTSVLGTTMAFALLLGSARAESPAVPTQEAEKLGYGIGYQVGSDFRRSGRPLDSEALQAGVRDALGGATPRWTAAEMREALRRLEEANATGAASDELAEPADSGN